MSDQIQNSAIRFESISHAFSDKTIIDDVSFDLARGKTYCLIGESGSGKTTLMRLMNGLLEPRAGKVFVEGRPINYSQTVDLRRNMGYARQGSGLFPQMTVHQNMSLVARRSGWSAEKCRERSRELLADVYLNADEVFNKKPSQLSGGQKQRVGIARSLFMKPQVMLMDEPFGALDPNTRTEIQDLFIELQKKQKLTTVIVTHDLSEAFKMADEILLLKDGSIEQRGTVSELLRQPKTPYVRSFLSTQTPSHMLKTIPVYSVMNTKQDVIAQAGLHVGESLTEAQSLYDAIQILIKQPEVPVKTSEGRVVGVISREILNEI